MTIKPYCQKHGKTLTFGLDLLSCVLFSLWPVVSGAPSAGTCLLVPGTEGSPAARSGPAPSSQGWCTAAGAGARREAAGPGAGEAGARSRANPDFCTMWSCCSCQPEATLFRGPGTFRDD